MKFPKNIKLEQAIGKDNARVCLTHAYLDCSEPHPHLVATTGQIIAVIPVQAEKEEQGYLSVESLKAARKVGTRHDEAEIICNHNLTVGGTVYQRPTSEKPYPNWKPIIPDANKPGTIRLGLNATLLKNLADALGEEKLILEIDPANPNAGIRVTVDGSENIGVIAPFKVK